MQPAHVTHLFPTIEKKQQLCGSWLSFISINSFSSAHFSSFFSFVFLLRSVSLSLPPSPFRSVILFRSVCRPLSIYLYSVRIYTFQMQPYSICLITHAKQFFHVPIVYLCGTATATNSDTTTNSQQQKLLATHTSEQ